MPPQQPAPASKGKLKVIADALNVRESPSLRATIIGSVRKDDIVDLIDSSKDDNWYEIQKANLTGWSSHRFLVPEVPTTPPGPLEEILRIAGQSAIAGYKWKNRGVAPRGYIKGMALVYARVYCKLRANDLAAIEMGKENTGDVSRDALAWYAQIFQNAGMNNEAAGVNTLRHLFVLLIGLGMRDSSGRYCEGRDRSATNVTANTAEAGPFQVSFDASSASPLPAGTLSTIFGEYFRLSGLFQRRGSMHTCRSGKLWDRQRKRVSASNERVSGFCGRIRWRRPAQYSETLGTDYPKRSRDPARGELDADKG